MAGAPATRTSMCILFLATFGSGTRKKTDRRALAVRVDDRRTVGSS